MDQEILVKFDIIHHMRRAVRLFNKNFRYSFTKIHEKTYYTFKGERISSRQFKILDVPNTIIQEIIEENLRKILHGKPFYIRPNNGIKVNKENTSANTVYFSVKDDYARNAVKFIWSIDINNELYR